MQEKAAVVGIKFESGCRMDEERRHVEACRHSRRAVAGQAKLKRVVRCGLRVVCDMRGLGARWVPGHRESNGRPPSGAEGTWVAVVKVWLMMREGVA